MDDAKERHGGTPGNTLSSRNSSTQAVCGYVVPEQAKDLLDLLYRLRGGQANPTQRDDGEVAERTRAGVDELTRIVEQVVT